MPGALHSVSGSTGAGGTPAVDGGKAGRGRWWRAARRATGEADGGGQGEAKARAAVEGGGGGAARRPATGNGAARGAAQLRGAALLHGQWRSARGGAAVGRGAGRPWGARAQEHVRRRGHGAGEGGRWRQGRGRR
ncbi:uncharacterized protein [Miscanthus floridulus]|uniref:uncharacterized protein n=1 Tax=Miscanthus floridulus TaxID=154761 RepID=UPI00345809C6